MQPGIKVARSIRAGTWYRVCEELKSQLTGRTVTNYTRTMRLVMKGCGHQRMAQDFTNASVALARLSRKGTKQPITDDYLNEVLSLCQRRRDPHQREALPVLIGLMRFVGLRVQEARMANKSAIPNLKRLETSTVVFVRDGTKGGRYRDVVLTPEDVPLVRHLLNESIRLAAKFGSLWPGANGRKAQHSLAEALRSVGLKGKFSPHSLRYRFAHEQAMTYQRQGFDEAVAIEHTAMDLGHGGARRDLMIGTYYQKQHRGVVRAGSATNQSVATTEQ